MVPDPSRFFIQDQQSSFIQQSGEYGVFVHINSPDIMIQHLAVLQGKVVNGKKGIVQVLFIQSICRADPEATFTVFIYRRTRIMSEIFFAVAGQQSAPEIKMEQIEPVVLTGYAEQAVVDKG